jgi:predicted NAD-dependent protein-ADP-ribosyltransferase YbiA (DUF1768 family)
MSNDKLFYFSKSRDVLPGKGLNEIVENHLIYNDLAKIKDWRKILSNFHIFPFIYEGYTYNTIEHAFQAKKINIVDNNKALLFTIDSGHDIGLGDGLIARKNRKICKLNKEQLQLWDNIKNDIMNKITIEKYKVCKEACIVLINTKNAQLWHIVSRSKPFRVEYLENIRDNYLSSILF